MAKALIDSALETDKFSQEAIKFVNKIASCLGSKFTVTLENKAEKTEITTPKQIAKHRFGDIAPRNLTKYVPTVSIQYITPLGGKYKNLADKEIALSLAYFAQSLSHSAGVLFEIGKGYLKAEFPPTAAKEIFYNIKGDYLTTGWIKTTLKNYEDEVSKLANNASKSSHAENVLQSRSLLGSLSK